METFNKLLLDYPRLMYGGVGATAFVAGGALIYKIATRKKPTHANVNCWFCNGNTVVPYGNRNCWDCPTCDQYNGFQENGDYNKPIPAQHMEHLNHGVSGSLPSSEMPKCLQYVNCQMLLCKKCNNNQTVKIKQLASYIPRDDENYDEEIEAYKHHLEQTYKLCRPCQTAVEYYIKYQNRQLRTILLNHQLRRTRESDMGFIKGSLSPSSPLGVILLRALVFLICAFLFITSMWEFPEHSISQTGPQTLSGGVVPPKPKHHNESATKNDSSGFLPMWQDLLALLPDQAVANAKIMWQYGRDNQLAVTSVGLLTCLTAVFFAGPARLRRIDAVASVLWFVIMCLQLAEGYFTDAVGWMDSAKLSIIGLCCLVSFAAGAATRKPMGPRRARNRRYLAGSSDVFSPHFVPAHDPTASFIPTPPPNLPQLFNRQHGNRERKASPSSLPVRLSRALRLGTMPPLTRTDSGYLFSGSRPTSPYKDPPSSEYFLLNPGSRPSSPGPSPTPSIAGSVTSSSGSARRRPLISPARLNISGQRLCLFSTNSEPRCTASPTPPLHFFTEPTSSVYSSCVLPDTSHNENNDLSSLFREGSVIEEAEKRSSSSESSACLVGTTTQGLDVTPPPNDFAKRLIWPGLLVVSLTANLLFSTLYVYHNWI